jgi:hypothetical protein
MSEISIGEQLARLWTREMSRDEYLQRIDPIDAAKITEVCDAILEVTNGAEVGGKLLAMGSSLYKPYNEWEDIDLRIMSKTGNYRRVNETVIAAFERINQKYIQAHATPLQLTEPIEATPLFHVKDEDKPMKYGLKIKNRPTKIYTPAGYSGKPIQLCFDTAYDDMADTELKRYHRKRRPLSELLDF